MALIDREVRNAVLSGLATAQIGAQEIDIPFEQGDFPGGAVATFKHIGTGPDPVSGKQLFVLTFVFVAEELEAVEAIAQAIEARGRGEAGSRNESPTS